MNTLEKASRFLRREEGATATEYAVMIALVILIAIAAVLYLGQTVEGLFNDFGSMFAESSGSGS